MYTVAIGIFYTKTHATCTDNLQVSRLKLQQPDHLGPPGSFSQKQRHLAQRRGRTMDVQRHIPHISIGGFPSRFVGW